MNQTKWCENVILADADYVDKAAFELTVHFERVLGRRIPQADLARWLECVALDGGLRPSESRQQQTQVILIHQGRQMDNFLPGVFSDLDGQAFSGGLGEFLISCVQVEPMVTAGELFAESLQVMADAAEVRRLMVVPAAEDLGDRVCGGLRHADDDKRVTVFSMQPMPGAGFRQETLGYSLMAALGIRTEELTAAR